MAQNGCFYKAVIIHPDGRRIEVFALGYGNTESEMEQDAQSNARLIAGMFDEAAHLPTGSHKVGEIKKSENPFKS